MKMNVTNWVLGPAAEFAKFSNFDAKISGRTDSYGERVGDIDS